MKEADAQAALAEEKSAESGSERLTAPAANPKSRSQRGRRTNDWFSNPDTKEKIPECARIKGIAPEDCTFIISGGDNAYRGTYIHPMLYDHFVMWLSPIYSMRVSAILSQHHHAANMKIIAEKDDNIIKLQATVDRIEATNREQSADIKRLLEFGHTASYERAELKEQLDEASDERAELKEQLEASTSDANREISQLGDAFEQACGKIDEIEEEVKIINDHLEDKSFVSTMNPAQDDFHHHALVLEKTTGLKHELRLISGQSKYVDKRRAELLSGAYRVVNDKFYQANGIDYRRNVQTRVSNHIEEELRPVNEIILQRRAALQQEIDETNAMLLEDIPQSNADLAERIRVYNLTATKRVKLSSNGTRYYHGFNRTFANVRSYEKECRSYEKEIRASRYKLVKVPISVNSTYISWLPNDYVSLDKIKELIAEVNAITQRSPHQSDAEDSE
jgi:hypothetical protein